MWNSISFMTRFFVVFHGFFSSAWLFDSFSDLSTLEDWYPYPEVEPAGDIPAELATYNNPEPETEISEALSVFESEFPADIFPLSDTAFFLKPEPETEISEALSFFESEFPLDLSDIEFSSNTFPPSDTEFSSNTFPPSDTEFPSNIFALSDTESSETDFFSDPTMEGLLDQTMEELDQTTKELYNTFAWDETPLAQNSPLPPNVDPNPSTNPDGIPTYGTGISPTVDSPFCSEGAKLICCRSLEARVEATEDGTSALLIKEPENCVSAEDHGCQLDWNPFVCCKDLFEVRRYRGGWNAVVGYEVGSCW
jgi:hypothetical protein